MKSRNGKIQRREEKKKEDQKRESFRRKRIQVREKSGKSRNTVFFQWFVAPEGRKVGTTFGVDPYFQTKQHLMLPTRRRGTSRSSVRLTTWWTVVEVTLGKFSLMNHMNIAWRSPNHSQSNKIPIIHHEDILWLFNSLPWKMIHF